MIDKKLQQALVRLRRSSRPDLIAACLEVSRRLYEVEQPAERIRLSKPSEVYAVCKDIGKLRKEHLIGLYVDAQNGLIARETISVGSLNATRTHPREIFGPAIQHLALSVILAHNHPSGSLVPSLEDLEFTKHVQRAGETLGFELYDHLIISSTGYSSLREMGQI